MMKKLWIAVSLFLIVLAGAFFPGMDHVGVQAEQAPEDVLRISEYETEEGSFKEVRNLQEYRQLLSAQGLSDYETAVRMLEVSGYTQEQIEAMPEAAVLQNLTVKESKVQLTCAEPEQPLTRASGSGVSQGLNMSIGYRTIELSRYSDGRDPEDFLLISAHFDWAGATNGMPAFKSNDFIVIYNYTGDQVGVDLSINRDPLYDGFPSYEVFSGSCKNASGQTIALQSGLVDYSLDELACIVAFNIPTDSGYKDISGYYQVLGSIDRSVQSLQRIRAVYGHSYQTVNVGYLSSGMAQVDVSGFGLTGTVTKQFMPTTRINSTGNAALNYIYTPNDLDGIYTIKNVSTSRPMEVLGSNTALVTQGQTAFNETLASHRQNSAWQFDVFPISTSAGREFTIKSVATGRYFSTSVNGEKGLKTSPAGSRFYIQGNQSGQTQPCFEIIPKYDETKALAGQMTGTAVVPLIYLDPISNNYNTSDWFFIPVAAEDVGTRQTSYDPVNNGVYKLKNVGTGKYIEISDYNANVDVMAKPATASAQKTCQEFRLRISSGITELCPNHMIYHRLDVQGNTSTSGTPIQQYFKNSTDAQKFIVQPEKLVNGVMRFRIYTFSSGLNGVLQANTSDITQQTYSASATSQLWELVYQYTPDIDLETSSYFTFRNVKSGHFLDLENSATNNGTRTIQAHYNEKDSQQWRIEYIGDGLQIIRSRLKTSSVLDIDRSRNNNGTKVQLWNYENNKNQKFKLVQRYRGQYIIYANTSNFTKGLSVQDGSTASGAIVHQWEYTGTRELWSVNKMTTSSSLYDCSYIKKLSIMGDGTDTIYFTAPKTGSCTIETVGTHNTMVKLHDDSNGALLGTWNSNAGIGNNEKVTYTLTAGKRYRILVSVPGLDESERAIAGLLVY